VPPKFATAAATPLKASVGLAPVPSPLETLKPAPEVAIERLTSEPAPSLTTMPPPSAFNCETAPVSAI